MVFGDVKFVVRAVRAFVGFLAILSIDDTMNDVMNDVINDLGGMSWHTRIHK